MSTSNIGLVARYSDRVIGQLRCWDRVVIQGSLPEICHSAALEGELYRRGIRCFDIAQYAEPLREQIRANAQTLAEAAGLEIEHISKRNFRKEDRVAEILAKRGKHPGLIHVYSAMESCPAFKPWHDKKTGKTGMKVVQGKCLHYYFYWMHPRLGLCYVRVPTWLPFRLQIYFNGHNWLAAELDKAGVGYRMMDNAFVQIEDWEKAQQIAQEFPLEALQEDLTKLSKICCPVVFNYRQGYYWSLMQVEYSWDLVFRDVEALAPLYQELSRQAITTIRAIDVCRFFAKRLPSGDETPVESRLSTRKEGTRILHQLDKKASLKLYDKQARILRVECTSNDVSFFKHYRKVEHRDGSSTYKDAALKKSIFSLGDLRDLMSAACRRYLEFLSHLEDHSSGRTDLDKISRPVVDPQHRSSRGFNLFLAEDQTVLQILLRGEFLISGLSNRRFRKWLPDKTPSQIARILKRLRLHGLIKKIGKSYKYYLTQLGQRLLFTALKLQNHLIIPTLATP
jgi:hypothetical protein